MPTNSTHPNFSCYNYERSTLNNAMCKIAKKFANLAQQKIAMLGPPFVSNKLIGVLLAIWLVCPNPGFAFARLQNSSFVVESRTPLALRITSTTGFLPPLIRLEREFRCANIWHTKLDWQVADSLQWRISDNQTEAELLIPAGSLKAGTHCFVLVDQGTGQRGPNWSAVVKAPTPPRNLTVHHTPEFRIAWEASYGVPFTRLQLLDTLAGYPLLIWDVTTAARELHPERLGLSPVPTGARRTLRITNSADSTPATAISPWTTARIALPPDSMQGPQPLLPLANTILDDNLGQEFQWSAVPGAQQYRLEIFRFQDSMWTTCFQQSTNMLAIQLPSGSLCPGKLAWRVSAWLPHKWLQGESVLCSLARAVQPVQFTLRTLWENDTLLVQDATIRALPMFTQREEIAHSGQDGPGRAHLNLKEGLWEIQIQAQNFEPISFPLRSPLPRQMSIWLNPQPQQREPTSPIAQIISGQIRTENNNAPGPGSVQTWDLNGNLLAETNSDALGNFFLPINSNPSQIQISLPGRRAWMQKFATTPRTITAHLPAGSLVIGGIITRLHTHSDTEQYLQSLPQQLVKATHETTKQSLFAQTNNRGSWSISLPITGNWRVESFHQGDTIFQTVLFENSSGNQEKILDINFVSSARLQVVARAPNSNPPPSVQVFLIHRGSIAQQAIAVLQGQWYVHEFPQLEAGSYLVRIAGQGITSQQSLPVNIPLQSDFTTRNLYSTDTLQLMTAQGRLILHLNTPAHAGAKWQAQIPHAPFLQSGDTLQSAGIGSLLVRASRADSTWLAVYQHWSNADSSVIIPQDTLDFPFRDISQPNQFLSHPDSSIVLRLLAPIARTDSSWALIQKGRGTELLSNSERRGDTLHFRIPAGSYANKISYSICARSGQTQWCRGLENQTGIALSFPSRPFRLHWPFTDTLRLAVGSSINLKPLVADQEGYPYTEFFSGGQLNWSLHGNGFSITTSHNSSQAQLRSRQTGTARLQVSATHGVHSDSVILNLRSLPADSLKSLRLGFTRPPPWLAGDTIELRAMGLNDEASSWEVNADFSLHPPQAGRIHGSALILDSLFLGPLQIFAQTGNLQDSSGVEVLARVPANSSDRFFHHDSNTFVHIPDSAWTGHGHLLLRLLMLKQNHIAPAPVEMGLVLGNFYALDFPLAIPSRAPRLLFAVADNETAITEYHAQNRTHSQHHVGQLLTRRAYADSMNFNRTTLPNGRAALSVNPRCGHPLYYGMVGQDQRNLKPWLRLLPNPFSPFVIATADGNENPGQAVQFYPFLKDATQVLVSLRIFNTAGERVRVLMDNSILPIQQHTLWWNGISDSGRLVRNGRYLVVMEVRRQAGGKVEAREISYSVVFQ